MTTTDARLTRIRVLGWVIWLGFTLVFLYVAFSARLLRPASDDYCMAVDAQRGVVGALAHWWEVSSGYVTFGLGAATFVGLPGLHLPWPLTSAIPFLVGALAIGVTVATVLWFATPRSARTWARLLLAIPVAAVAWWSFLWLPQGYSATGTAKQMAEGLTHWQILNGSYVFLTTVLVVAPILLWVATTKRPALVWTFAIFGLVAGLGGPTFGGTTLAVSLVALAYVAVFGAQHRRLALTALALTAVTAALASLAAHVAPGSQARQGFIGSEPVVGGVRSTAELFHAVLPRAIFTWLESFTHAGSLFVLVLAIAAGWLLARQGVHLRPSSGIALSLVLLSAGMIFSTLAVAAQKFAYEAYYHHTPAWMLTFFATASIGVAVGSALERRPWAGDLATALGVLLLALVIAASAILFATTSMAERLKAWESGSAPMVGAVYDLDDGWWGCWNGLAELRDVPDRGEPAPK